MLYPKLLIAANPEECAKLAANHFEELIRSKPACVLGLATGSTPIPLYKELVAREKAGKIDFSRVRSANLDEYKGLTGDHPQSYRYFMQDNLFNHIGIKPENTIVPDGLATDVEAMAKAYISMQLANSIVFAVLIIVLLVRPAGLLGKYVPEKV